MPSRRLSTSAACSVRPYYNEPKEKDGVGINTIPDNESKSERAPSQNKRNMITILQKTADVHGLALLGDGTSMDKYLYKEFYVNGITAL